MNIIKSVSSIILVVFLSACGTTINTKPISLPINEPPIVQTTLEPIEWKVINKDNIQIDDKKNYFILDERNFRILTKNLLEMMRLAREQEQVILFYRELNSGKNDQ